MKVLHPCPHCNELLYVTSASAHRCPQMPRRCYRCQYWQRIADIASAGWCRVDAQPAPSDELDTCPRWEAR